MVSKRKCAVFVDTAVRFSTAEDENSSRQQQQLWIEMTNLRIAGCPVVVALHHSPKSQTGEELSLENVLRGSGDIGAQADAVYGIRRDESKYRNGEGPNELLIACVKPRDFDPPKPFKIAMTHRTDDGSIISFIDRDGDFAVLDLSASIQDLQNRFIDTITEYPEISEREVADQLKEKRWAIQKIAKKLGYARIGKKWIYKHAAPALVVVPETKEKPKKETPKPEVVQMVLKQDGEF
jgi:hypothetical protein